MVHSNFFRQPVPVRVKILNQEFHVVQGAENIKALFKNSWICTSTVFIKFALGYAFGLPAKPLALYDRDDSGGGAEPHPGSKVKPENRIEYLEHQSMTRFLEGPGLQPFWLRFASDITQRLHDLHHRTASEFHSEPDLMQLFGDESIISAVNALCGPHLLRLNPTFLHDFWVFDRNLQTYMRGTPWIFAPKAFASRKRVLDAVRTWQQYARENFVDSAIGPDGDDPYWGSSFFRERQKMFLSMDGFDEDAIASPDFGAIWATRNALTASSWMIYELYRDPQLLCQVRSEVATCISSRENGRISFDINMLLKLPLLQAVYAETLRLRMHFYVIRMPDRLDMNIRDWIIPKRKVIVTSTTVAHRDPRAWDTGSENEHPVDTFWPGRFLKRAPDSKSGPIFSTKDLEGSWIPYGGGPRQCPGRHFAKRQILLTSALIISLFDCELLGAGQNLEEDLSLSGFGGGISHPAGKVPVRMRRRDIAPSS
ncbi:cytochrome P450 [Corynespora cassiicola Philippines]|uniref:Cytochrome P450 n=1 Tax=Corynespora cassiicola Philippines TaxID=1448308 RepID=A0A2T2N802_CORCC|nr:cytochrome P450 [Corynespora cassiicola Philippines]